ncbi:MAG: antibiotic biosynthesis monooxygenase [Terracidiphilus sp.]|jgi:quinol monooxygenase YgiN
MDQFALFAQLRARPGKEAAVEEFLVSARALVLLEIGTITWYAVKFDSSLYGIFDTFPNQESRDAHLNGQTAELLFAKAEELFAEPPVIQMLDILATNP